MGSVVEYYQGYRSQSSNSFRIDALGYNGKDWYNNLRMVYGLYVNGREGGVVHQDDDDEDIV